MSPLALFGIGCAVFLAATAYDVVYTCYLDAFARRHRVASGNWSVATYCIGIIGTASVLKVSGWMILPECLGLWIGSAIGAEIAAARDRD